MLDHQDEINFQTSRDPNHAFGGFNPLQWSLGRRIQLGLSPPTKMRIFKNEHHQLNPHSFISNASSVMPASEFQSFATNILPTIRESLT